MLTDKDTYVHAHTHTAHFGLHMTGTDRAHGEKSSGNIAVDGFREGCWSWPRDKSRVICFTFDAMLGFRVLSHMRGEGRQEGRGGRRTCLCLLVYPLGKQAPVALYHIVINSGIVRCYVLGGRGGGGRSYFS